MERESHESFIRKRFGVCLSGIAVVLLAIAILLAPNLPLTSTVYACSEPPGGFPVYTVAERTDAADLVLEGTVIEVTGDVNQMEAKVAVERYFKDRGPETVIISGLGSSALCLSPVTVGQTSIFYTKGNPEIQLTASYLTAHDAVARVTDENVAQVITAVGHDPVPPYAHHAYLAIVQTID